LKELDFFSSFASKKSFVLVYTLCGMLFTAGGAYTSGIISTLEKQYKLSSTKIGVMYALEDVISGIIAILIPYYTSKGHYPRWISFGMFLLGISLFLQSSPYFVYGPGKDAKSLTEEHGTKNYSMSSALGNINQNELANLCFANSKFN
jgi:solute carrier organic anion transporter family, member 5A